MRLFIGINFNHTVLQQLASLRGTLPYVQWYDPQTYHLTLSFIGEINNYDLINDLDLALEKIPFHSFDITIHTVNFFQYPSNELIFWAGIQPSEDLILLYKKINQCLKFFKINQTNKKYIPHITLGKGSHLSTEHIKRWLSHYNLLTIPDVQISHFSLFSSYPNKEQPCYVIEKNYPLLQKS